MTSTTTAQNNCCPKNPPHWVDSGNSYPLLMAREWHAGENNDDSYLTATAPNSPGETSPSSMIHCLVGKSPKAHGMPARDGSVVEPSIKPSSPPGKEGGFRAAPGVATASPRGAQGAASGPGCR